jgi:hypothetical protein
MAEMPSSALNRAFYRQTFEIKNNRVSKYRHTLLINPEDMSVEEPHRATVTQTLGGAYLALFGQGLQTVTISGKTGFHARIGSDGTLTDGYTEIKRLRNYIYREIIMNPSDKIEMFWYNWEDDEYYQIMPLSLRIQRSTSLGKLYRYELQFICIKILGGDLSAPLGGSSGGIGGIAKPSADNLLTGVRALEIGQALIGASSGITELTGTAEAGGVPLS